MPLGAFSETKSERRSPHLGANARLGAELRPRLLMVQPDEIGGTKPEMLLCRCVTLSSRKSVDDNETVHETIARGLAVLTSVQFTVEPKVWRLTIGYLPSPW